MNDMERRKFEDSFQEAFKDAELNPSENVWTNIELDLERANGDSMKKRIVFFKMLAAASLVFALCAGGLTYYIFSDNGSSSMIAQQRNSDEDQVIEKNESNSALNKGKKEQALSPHNESSPSDLNAATAQNTVRQNTEEGKSSAGNSLSSTTPPNSNNSQVKRVLSDDSSESTLTTERSVNEEAASKYTMTSERRLPKFYEPNLPELKLPASTADPGMVLLARLAEEERKYSEEQKTKKSKSEGLWTSVGFAAGAFAANNPNVTPAPSNSFQNLMANTVQTAAKQSKASGTSYSLGVSLGTKISERWVVQGGINYLTQSSDYTANSVVVIDNNYSSLKAESLNAFTGQIADASAQPKVAQTFPYNVNNNVRFVSVPVQAGYLLIDRKFGVQLNAGVSTDLFLQNTITPDGGGVTKTTQGRGEDSPYRSLNFSGLMGTELSYKLGSRYRVSLNPGLRYPFKSVYKDNMGIDATPLTFDVGLRFRYIFH